MNITIKFLRKNEWTMGNGQCHECLGCDPNSNWWTEKVGHKKGCQLAESLEELGEKVIWEIENNSDFRKKHMAFFKLIDEIIYNDVLLKEASKHMDVK